MNLEERTEIQINFCKTREDDYNQQTFSDLSKSWVT